jgi:UDP-N-acetylmuramate: L-alanyl-gamma-D-glutamyl-meso-diaminopimelate ligase
LAGRAESYGTVAEIIETLAAQVRPEDHVLIMSNGGFDNIHARLIARLQT